ncbi:MAG TPA: peptidase S41, partial [Myxococcales bacterium]|nr:peptidase S41 [Myxococcales bacterium]
APIYRLRAFTKSDNTILDRREFVFGQLQPHEKRTWTVPVKVPRYMPSRRDDVTVKFEDEQGDAIEDVRGESDIQELPRPSFAWSWQLAGPSSPDGLLHKGEQVELILDVKNIGQGKAYDAFAALKNLSEEKINVKKGRTKLGPIAPGETRTATFILEPKKGLDEAPVAVRLELGDKETWELEKEKLLLPVGALVPASPSVSSVRVQVDTNVLSAALETSDKLASVKKGAVLAAKGKVGAFYRVEWQKGRVGFLPAAAAKDATRGAKPTLAKVVALTQREPPFIKLTNVDTSKGGVEVDSDHLTLTGIAGDPGGMRDLQIFVQHENDYRKVFFRTAKKAGQSQSIAGPSVLDFTAELPLKPGNSTVYLIAREDDDLQAQRTLVIHRKQPAVAQAQKTRSAGTER